MKKIITLSFLLLYIVTEMAAGGPWPRKKGSGYTQIGFYAITPSSALSSFPIKRRLLHRSVTELSLPIYGEYGILDRFTIEATIPLKFVMTGATIQEIPMDIGSNLAPPDSILANGSLFGLGSCQLGLKYNFYNKDVHLTGHLNLSAPTGSSKIELALLTAPYRSWGIAPSLSVGVSGERWYLSVDAGVNFRTAGYSHEVLSNVEMGYALGKKKRSYFSWVLQARFSLPGGLDIPFISSYGQDIHTGLYINKENYLAWTLKMFIPLSKNGNLGINWFLSGGILVNNVQQAPSVGLSVFYRWGENQKVEEPTETSYIDFSQI